MKFKLNKKILTTIGLSFSLIFPIVLTSCGDSTSQQQVEDYLHSNDRIGGDIPFTSKYAETISTLYKRYGDKIYYRDQNDLLTLDLSKFTSIQQIHEFAFGDFTLEINRLILPPSAHQIKRAAFYPKTEKGYTYAKNGINPMFKVKNKKNAINAQDKHFFQLDVSQLGVVHEKDGTTGYGSGYTKKQGLPTQIYPIESFEFVNQNSSYDKFQWTNPSDSSKFSFSSPPTT